MTSVTIRPNVGNSSEHLYRAMAGGQQALGRTMGEALDAVSENWQGAVPEVAVFIQRFGGDEYFTDAQYERMRELLDRRPTLNDDEQSELTGLVEAELEATISRTNHLRSSSQS